MYNLFWTLVIVFRWAYAAQAPESTRSPSPPHDFIIVDSKGEIPPDKIIVAPVPAQTQTPLPVLPRPLLTRQVAYGAEPIRDEMYLTEKGTLVISWPCVISNQKPMNSEEISRVNKEKRSSFLLGLRNCCVGCFACFKVCRERSFDCCNTKEH